MKDKAISAVIFCMIIVFLAGCALAQSCPPNDGSLTPAQPTTLTGTVRYHNELRSWISLDPKASVCGQRKLQLTFVKGDPSLHYRQTKTLNGCEVQVTGQIERSVTAYYSATLYIADAKITPDKSCRPAPPSPDLSQVPIPAGIDSYKAKVTVDLTRNKPMDVRVWRIDSPNNSLNPWQIYVDAELNGSNSVWVSCRAGFKARDAFTIVDGKTRKAEDFLTTDTPGLVPSESGPSSITISCVRVSNQSTPASSKY